MKKINNIIAYDSKVAAVVKYYEEILVKNKENIKKFRGLDMMIRVKLVILRKLTKFR